MTNDAWDLANVDEVKRDLGIEKFEEIMIEVKDFMSRVMVTYCEHDELKVKRTEVGFKLEIDGMDFLLRFKVDTVKKDK